MKNVARIVLLLLVAAGGVWLWQWLFPSPEKVIAERFQKLAHAISVRPGEGYIPRLANAQLAGGFFDTNVEINVDVPHYKQHSTVTREEIVQTIAGANLTSGLDVKFLDVTVVVGGDGLTAQVQATVQGRSSGDSETFVQEVKFNLRKIDGKWVIVKAQTVRSLS